MGDLDLIPGLGRYPGEGKGYLLQYSGLENSMNRTIHGVPKSWTGLNDFHFLPQRSLRIRHIINYKRILKSMSKGSNLLQTIQAKVLEWAAMPSSKGSCQPRDRIWVSAIEPRSPSLQADYLPAEPQQKPKNTRVGSLSLLQRIFLTQELNRGLLLCRRILYQLSCQRTP